jgi:hypothetical protein
VSYAAEASDDSVAAENLTEACQAIALLVRS